MHERWRPTARASRVSLLAWGVFFAVASMAALLLWREIQNYLLYFGLYHDDAVYMVLGKALSSGQGYHLISIPGEIPETKYPIGLPLLLAFMWKLFPSFPENLLAIGTVQSTVALAALFAVMAYLYKTGKVTLLLALTIASATLVNSTFLDVAPMILSDYACLLSAMLALFLTERVAKKGTISSAIWLGPALALPALLRWQGLAAILAAIVYLGCHKRYRLAVAVLAGCLATLLPQVFWAALKQPEIPGLLSYYASYFPRTPDFELSPGRFLHVFTRSFAWNSSLQLSVAFPFLPTEYKPDVAANTMVVNIALGSALGIVAFIGALVELRRVSLPIIFCAFYASPIFIWPVMLEPRQLGPALPLAYLVFFRGFRTFARWLKGMVPVRRSLYRRLCAALAVAMAIYLVLGLSVKSLGRIATYADATDPDAPSFLPLSSNSQYRQAVSWITKHTNKTDVFISNNDALLFLFTGRQTMQAWRIDLFYAVRTRLPHPSALEAIEYSNAKYIIDDPMFRGFGAMMSPVSWLVATLHTRYPGSVVPVFSSSGGLITIFAVDSRRLPERTGRKSRL